LKRRIREAAEEEERINYGGRMSEEWLEDLKPFATDWQKPFLETAPWLVVVFKRVYEAGTRWRHAPELLCAGERGHRHRHAAGGRPQCRVGHPDPHAKPHELFVRGAGPPANERPFLLIPMGYPLPDCHGTGAKSQALEQVLVPFL
jgi:iodotyrosine deiodinase